MEIVSFDEFFACKKLKLDYSFDLPTPLTKKSP